MNCIIFLPGDPIMSCSFLLRGRRTDQALKSSSHPCDLWCVCQLTAFFPGRVKERPSDHPDLSSTRLAEEVSLVMIPTIGV